MPLDSKPVDNNRGVSEAGVEHHFGVPVTAVPGTVKELFEYVKKLEARVFALENQKPSEAPPSEAPPPAEGA